MRKFYLTKTAFLSAVLVALAVVACGLKISSISVDSNVEAGDEFDMTINLVKASDESSQWANFNGNYLYFGVRVPEDWSATKLIGIDTGNNTTAENNTFLFENSEQYAKVLDFCFPCKAGYKWIAFQSVKTYDVACQDGVKAVVTLKAGQALGTYDVDVVAGASTSVTPDNILTSTGEVNLNTVFGNDINGHAAGFSNGQTASVFKPSEYIMLFGTISKSEINERTAYLRSKGYTATVKDENAAGHTLPLEMEITNIYENGAPKVTVNQSTGIDDVNVDGCVVVNGGVDCVNVTADGAVVTVYNVAGRMIDTKMVNGEATLRAEKGVCLVEVVKNGKKVVKKVSVK